MEGPVPCARKIHFSLLEEDNQEEHQDFINCPMTMCAFTRHVCQAPDYFMFPEGYVTGNIHECCSNWKIPRPSPREAMGVVAEDGTPYIYYLWRHHHLDVLNALKS